MDSIDLFFKEFNISPESFSKWGIEKTQFADTNKVQLTWIELILKIENIKSAVHFRKPGGKKERQDAYLRFIREIINNPNLNYDKRTNVKSRRYFDEAFTGNRDSFSNYSVSHIWGRTKNPYAFNASWNMALTPVVITPFTDHMSKGAIKEAFSLAFKREAYKRFEKSISVYNKKMVMLMQVFKLNYPILESYGGLSKADIIGIKQIIEENFKEIEPT